MSNQNGWGMLELCVSLLIFGLLAVPLYILIIQMLGHSKDHQAMTVAMIQLHNYHVVQSSRASSILLPLWQKDNDNLLLGSRLSAFQNSDQGLCLSWKANAFVCYE